MMLVQILKFGSNWWARFGRDPLDHYRFTRHAAYFNSTGLRFGNKIRWHWIVPGLIRVNGVGDFNPQFQRRSVGATFECADLIFALAETVFCSKGRLPILHSLPVFSPSSPMTDLAPLTVRGVDWKAASVLPIAVSESREKQEAMLLMKRLDWVRTTLGVWQLKTGPNSIQSARLELLEDSAVA